MQSNPKSVLEEAKNASKCINPKKVKIIYTFLNGTR